MPNPAPSTPALWKSAATALLLGAASALCALALLSLISPASRPAPASVQAFKAIMNGQSALMRRAFAEELRVEAARGPFSWTGAVRINMLYAESGQALSFARVRKDSSRACELSLDIDGDGAPAMAQSSFSSFAGRIDGALPGLSPPQAAGAAFTVAHELGHCELGSQTWTSAANALATQAGLLGAPLLDSERSELDRFLSTPFGTGLIHEGYADAKAAQALARRMGRADFEALIGMVVVHRGATTLAFQARASLARDDAHHTQYALRALLGKGYLAARLASGDAATGLALDSAALGALAFFFAHPEARSQAGLSGALASKLARAGAASCQLPSTLGSKELDCLEI